MLWVSSSQVSITCTGHGEVRESATFLGERAKKFAGQVIVSIAVRRSVSRRVRVRAHDRRMNQRLPLVINRSLLARLDREWQAINERPAVLGRAAAWGLGVAFETLDDVVVATGYWSTPAQRREGDTGGLVSANEVLRRLLVAARTDDVAARVVLQRVLPGIIATSRRWGAGRPGGSVDAFDDMVSSTWLVIREFPTHRQSRHLAASVLRAAEYRAFQQSSRRLLVHELTAPNLLDVPVECVASLDASEELAEVLACASSLTEHELRLIELLASGCSAVEVAQQLRVSVRTVRNHRDAALQRVRMAAMAA